MNSLIMNTNVPVGWPLGAGDLRLMKRVAERLAFLELENVKLREENERMRSMLASAGTADLPVLATELVAGE